jgi:hypothetical protein
MVVLPELSKNPHKQAGFNMRSSRQEIDRFLAFLA